ncbi:hypothetical protein FA13DRAFT_342326 [Coprinellus micaceus]|uniref:Uncharacterized protein n=1 Tax=Coprinellus micaceus TaxID=71717 RepID=A0A4Y7SDD1_COPMI|nr:hypothetical protein FA13DRAFT_342326 [Coprinellus micaceus]
MYNLEGGREGGTRGAMRRWTLVSSQVPSVSAYWNLHLDPSCSVLGQCFDAWRSLLRRYGFLYVAGLCFPFGEAIWGLLIFSFDVTILGRDYLATRGDYPGTE